MSVHKPSSEKRITTHTLLAMKERGEKISMLTAYDYSMAKILDYKSNLASFESKIKEVHQLVETHEAQEKELNSQLSTLKTHLEELKLKRTDTSVLMAVGNWFTKQEQFQKLQMTNNTKIADKQEEGLKLKASFEALGLPSENWKAHLQAQTQTLEQKRQQLEEAKSQLVVAQELSHFADNLHDGENCPLCGATEHPNIRHTADVSELLKANAIALNESSAMLKTIQETVVQAEKRSHSISESNKQLQLLLKEKEALVTALENHLKLFVWKEFQANDVTSFEKKSKEQKQLEVAIKLAEEQIQALDASLQTVVGNCKQFTKTKNEIEQQKASIEGALNNEVLQLKSMLVADYEGIAVAEIKRQNAVLVEEVNRIALAYKEKSEVILQQREKVATLKGSLLSEKTQWELAGNNLLKQQTLIQQLLEKEAFDNLKSVEIILSKTWDVEKEKQKTAQFAFDTQTAQKAVVDAEQLVQTQTFDAEIFSHKMIAFTELAKGIETQIGLVSSLENERLKIEQSLVLKEKLLADFAVLESRATNLSILANMFSGSGFVNYVSSIYLQNLCDVANVRFHRMTKNQLSLSINISNEFEVVDYLNNGASRSVKTLSGGQGFQASLCLALALAESVQSLNKNNKNFFFIDEGFGTQDQESVAVVFETLQSLKKENRIVGIISHVAELQEQIPRSITILKEEEKGSVVSENWK